MRVSDEREITARGNRPHFLVEGNMSRLGANGDTPARNAGETADPVEAANVKPDDVFVKDYVPLLYFTSSRMYHDENLRS